MSIVVGLAVAGFVAGAEAGLGWDRDRSFYPTLLVVIATYYLLFSAMTESSSSGLFEVLACLVFMAMAIAGHRHSMWWVAAGLVGHGVFDAVHYLLWLNNGVPVFCAAVDVALGAGLAVLLWTGRRSAQGIRTVAITQAEGLL